MIGALLRSPWAAVGGLLAVLAAVGIIYLAGRAHGALEAERRIIDEIADQNEEAGHDAEACRDRYRQCAAAGGLFDFADCTCRH
jgi:hypothetical protein